MAFVWVKNSTGLASATASSTGTITFATAPAAGNLIVVNIGGWKATGTGITSVTDNQGNSYSIVANPHTDAVSMACIAYAKNIVYTSGTFTITITASGTYYFTGMASEFSGSSSTSPLDVYGSGTGAAAITCTATTSGSVSAVDDLVVAVANNATGGGDCAWVNPTGYTQIFQNGSSGGSYSATQACYKILTAGSGAQNAVWTWTGSVTWSCVIATFRLTGGAVDPPRIFFKPKTTLRM